MDAYKVIQDEKVTIYFVSDDDQDCVHFSIFYDGYLFKKRRLLKDEAREYWKFYKRSKYKFSAKFDVNKDFLGYCQFAND